jgi:hypothetical protein
MRRWTATERQCFVRAASTSVMTMGRRTIRIKPVAMATTSGPRFGSVYRLTADRLTFSPQAHDTDA